MCRTFAAQTRRQGTNRGSATEGNSTSRCDGPGAIPSEATIPALTAAPRVSTCLQPQLPGTFRQLTSEPTSSTDHGEAVATKVTLAPLTIVAVISCRPTRGPKVHTVDAAPSSAVVVTGGVAKPPPRVADQATDAPAT